MHFDRVDSTRELESKLRSDNRLRVWIGLLVVLSALNAVVTLCNNQRFTRDAAQVAHTHRVLDHLNSLWAKLLAAESGQRAFVITGDPEQVRELTEARGEADFHIEQLATLTLDNGVQSARIPELRDAVAARIARMEHVRDLRERSGFEAARSGIGTGRDLMARVHSITDAMRSEELRLLEERTRLSNRSRVVGGITTVGQALFGLCVLVLFYQALRRHLIARRQAMNLLYVERERFRTTLASIGDGVITTDTAGRVTFLNEIAEQLTGYSLDEARGRDLQSIFMIVNETTRERVDNPALRALRDGAIVGLANHTILIAKDGVERAIDDSAAPIRSESHEVTGSVLVFRDVTSRRVAEHEIDERARVMRMRIEIGDVLTGDIDHATGLARCAELCVRNLDAEFCRIWITSECGQHLELRASAGTEPAAPSGPVRIRFGETRIGRVASTRVPYFTNEAGSDAELASHDGSSADLVCAVAVHPLDVEGKTLGVLGIGSNHPLSRALFDELDLISHSIAQFISRKQLEAARQRLAELVENSNDPITVFNADGTLSFMNRAGKRAFFRDSEQVPVHGRPIRELFFDDDREPLESKYLPEVTKAGRSEFELRMRYLEAEQERAGDTIETPKWMNCHAFSMFDSRGIRTGVGMVCRDVSDRRRSEQRMQQSEEEYRQLAAELKLSNQRLEREMQDRVEATEKLERRSQQLQAIAEIATRLNVVHDIDPIMTVITEGARRIVDAHVGLAVKPSSGPDARNTGAPTPPRIVASLSAKYEAWSADPQPLVVPRAHQIVAKSKKPLRVTREDVAARDRWPRAGDSVVHPPTDLLVAPLSGFDGSILGTLHLMDRTHGTFSVEDEAILVQLALMGSVAIENSRLYAELFEADQRKDEFLATLAHELRNPLAPIRNGLEILQHAHGNPATFEQVRQMMERQIHMMVRLVDDLLDVSRITRGKIALQLEHFDLALAVQDAIDTSRPIIDSAEHRLSVELPVEPTFVRADRVRIVQVLANLLNNAAKFTPDGGTIRLHVEQDGDHAVVRVRDDGIGIEPEMLPRIFDIFTQVDHRMKRTKTGVGIGLALVKKIVELHGGSVAARSEGTDRGSELIVRLPVAQQEPEGPTEPQPSAQERPADRQPRHRILVVDDHKDSAESLSELLRWMGNEVRTCFTAQEALAAAQEFMPDLFFLDIGLPDMSGYELAVTLRALPAFRSAFLIAQTGWGQDADRRRSVAAGFNAHLVKPIDIDLLRKLLSDL